MADLFTNVLAGFIIATIASWRYAWITPPLIVTCLVDAAIPDRNRIDLVLPAETITALTGLPWSWGVLHRGGALLAHRVYAVRVSLVSTTSTDNFV